MAAIRTIDDPETLNKLADHITQSWQWGDFRLTTPNVKRVLRLASGNKAFQIFFHRVPHLPYTVAYLPRSEAPSEQELEEIEKYCKKEKALFLKIEPITECKMQNVECKIGKPILPRHTIYIDLTLSEEKLLANMHEKTRYNIKLAQKKGVVVKEESSSEALEEFIQLLENTEKRQAFYSHQPNYYRKLWDILSPEKMVYLLSAYVGEKMAASIMLFRFKDTLYYPYGGSDPQFREFMAPNLLHWEAIKLGKKLGCKTYDLWGSYQNKPVESDPWWGIYRFKSGFGGEDITFPETVDIPLSPLYQLYPLADKFRWLVKR